MMKRMSRYLISQTIVLAATMLAAITLVGRSLPAQDTTPPGFRAYILRYAAAEDVTGRLNKLLSDLGVPFETLIDRNANRVLVKGTEQAQQLASKFLATVDKPVTTVPATNSESAPPVLRGYNVPSPEATLQEMVRQFPPKSGVRLAADKRTGQLIVIAPEEIHRRIAQLLSPQTGNANSDQPSQPQTSIDQTQPNGRSHQLKNLSWQQLEDELRRVLGKRVVLTSQRNGELAVVTAVGPRGPQPVVQIDRRRNSVDFLGAPATTRMWQRVVQAIDAPQDRVDQTTDLVALHRADPTRIQRAVELLQAVSKLNTSIQPAPNQATGVVPRRNGDLFSMIFQPAQNNENQNQGAGQPANPNAPLGQNQNQNQNAPADQNANLNQDPPDNQGNQNPGAGVRPLPAASEDENDESVNVDGGQIGPVQIEFLEGLIVIRGHQRDVDRVRKIIADIEEITTETQPDIEVYQLKFTSSQSMSALISEVYTEILSPRQGPVTVRALVKPNALLLIGQKENVEVIKTLISKLDQPVAPETQFEVFQLKHMSALDAAETLQNFFVDRLNEGQAGAQAQAINRPGLGSRVNVVAEYRSNSLIVQAGPSDLLEARKLIERIDVEKAGSANEIKIFRLKNALSTDVAPVLQDALNWELIGNRTPVNATAAGGLGGGQGFGQATDERARLRSALKMFRVDSENGEILESGILSDVRITADINGNALIVSAPSNSMGLIAALVDELDRLPNAKAQIKVFTIINGDATTLSNMLTQLLSQTTQGNQQAGGLFGQGNLNPFLSPGLQAGAASGESTLVPVRFAVDQRTNSIIASGSEGDLGVVEAVLLRLDEEIFKQHETAVYWLANSSATEVAAAVNGWLDTRAAIFDEQVGLSPESPTIQFQREVIVVPEQLSNSIIISATPTWFEEVKRVVESLDRRPPLIKVDVLIAEVALNDIYEFGAEYGLQSSLLFDRQYAAPNSLMGQPGYNFNNVSLGDIGGVAGDLAGQGLTTFGLSRVSAEEGYGGLVLSASNDAVSVLIRALKEDGRAQILSRPTITTLDGQSGFINVGATVSRLAGTTQNVNNSQQNVVDTPTGITLGIVPRITPDGLVVMQVDATKSSLSTTEGVELPDGFGGTFFQGNIDTITTQTTISARSGQTVVFSGLIKHEKGYVTKGIPHLSKLPWVGPLFRFDRTVDRRTELLIILTPHIVRSDQDLDWIKYSETERMSWCLSDVNALWGDEQFASRPGPWCDPCDIPVIFPSSNPLGIEGREGVPEMAPAEMLRLPPPQSSSRRSDDAGDVDDQASSRPGPTPRPIPNANTTTNHFQPIQQPSMPSGPRSHVEPGARTAAFNSYGNPNTATGAIPVYYEQDNANRYQQPAAPATYQGYGGMPPRR